MAVPSTIELTFLEDSVESLLEECLPFGEEEEEEETLTTTTTCQVTLINPLLITQEQGCQQGVKVWMMMQQGFPWMGMVLVEEVMVLVEEVMKLLEEVVVVLMVMVVTLVLTRMILLLDLSFQRK